MTPLPPLPPEVVDPVDPFESFGRSITRSGRSEATATAYQSDMRKFLAWNGGTLPPPQGYADRCLDFINELRTTNTSPSSVIRYMTTLRQYREWAVQNGEPDTVEPFVDYKAPSAFRTMAHPLPGGQVDVKSMVDAAWRPHHRILIGLCGYAGLRISEARAVTPRSLIIDSDGFMWIAVFGKGGKYREVPVSDDLKPLLLPIGERDPDTPFVPIGDRAARKAITGVARRAGISREVSSHDLRHTFATDIYDKTKDLRVTQELLGHASSSTTEGYTGVSHEAMRKAVLERLT